MKISGIILAGALALGGLSGVASADPWKDESGHGRGGFTLEFGIGSDDRYYPRERYERRGYRERSYSRNCWVEREWSGGEYREVTVCERGPSGYYYRR